MTRGPKWPEITAVFGGTFDPPHLGHREAVLGLFQEPGVQRVRVVPSATPPHKGSAITPVTHRVEMTRRCFENLPDVALDLRELERSQRLPMSATYSFDTLVELGRELPQTRLAFVVGADQLSSLHKWYRFPEVLALSHWIVLARKPGGDTQARETLRDWTASGLIGRELEGQTWQIRGTESFLKLVPTPARQATSTQVREAFARTGRPPEGAISDTVLAYLKLHRLYGSESQ